MVVNTPSNKNLSNKPFENDLAINDSKTSVISDRMEFSDRITLVPPVMAEKNKNKNKLR